MNGTEHAHFDRSKFAGLRSLEECEDLVADGIVQLAAAHLSIREALFATRGLRLEVLLYEAVHVVVVSDLFELVVRVVVLFCVDVAL